LSRILQAARADAEAEKESILEQVREAKNASQETRQVVDVLILNLKAERERQALSLADVEERTGIRRSVLSRLENDATSNPTMLKLQRYAVALGSSLRAELTSTH
jgi:transcriptional regulator with XRE-family HTH domain